MWWKALSVILLLYVITTGLLVPLKPGITHVTPETFKTGQTAEIQFHGYNTFYSRSAASDIRIWLEYDSLHAVAGQNIRVLSDTTLSASFAFPTRLPRPTPSVMLNAIIDHPADGVSLLPGAIELAFDASADTSAPAPAPAPATATAPATAAFLRPKPLRPVSLRSGDRCAGHSLARRRRCMGWYPHRGAH